MKVTKNSIHQAVVAFIARSYHEKDWAVLHRLDLDFRQARKLSQLTALEAQNLESVSNRYVGLEMHFTKFDSCYQHIRQDTTPLSKAQTLTKEVDLCLGTINHMMRLYRAHHRTELAAIGVKPHQAEFISTLSTISVQRLSPYYWQFTRLQVDSDRLAQGVESSVATAHWVEQCIRLVRAGAPRDLMVRYYGMSCEMYAEIRGMYGDGRRGRPRTLSDQLQKQIFMEFMRQYRHYSTSLDPLHQPTFFLDIYEGMEHKASVRDIWVLVQEWMNTRSVIKQLQ